MGCEFVKKWKSVVPVPLQMIPVVGCAVYWGLRIGYPWIIHVPRVLGLAYPELTETGDRAGGLPESRRRLQGCL